MGCAETATEEAAAKGGWSASYDFRSPMSVQARAVLRRCSDLQSLLPQPQILILKSWPWVSVAFRREQVFTLLERGVRMNLRTPSLSLARLLQQLFHAIVVGLIFFQSPEALSKNGAATFLILNQVGVSLLSSERTGISGSEEVCLAGASS